MKCAFREPWRRANAPINTNSVALTVKVPTRRSGTCTKCGRPESRDEFYVYLRIALALLFDGGGRGRACGGGHVVKHVFWRHHVSHDAALGIDRLTHHAPVVAGNQNGIALAIGAANDADMTV